MTLLDRCFEGAPNVPKRLLKVPASVEKAEEHDWAITCGYYAMYHATMASLWLIGLEARSHECAISAFEMFYVKEQKVDKEYLDYVKRAKTLGKKYSDSLEYAKTERIKASYGLGEITSQEASKVLSDAREFVATIDQLALGAKGLG